MDVWTRIDRELTRRRTTWASLGREIGASDQVMTNWKGRKRVPADRYLAISKALGWSVEQLVGDAPLPAGGSPIEPAAGHAAPRATEDDDRSGRGWFDGTDMTPQECELVSIFRQLSPSGRLVALGQVRLARDTQEHMQEAIAQRRQPSPVHVPHSRESGFGDLHETPEPKKGKVAK